MTNTRCFCAKQNSHYFYNLSSLVKSWLNFFSRGNMVHSLIQIYHFVGKTTYYYKIYFSIVCSNTKVQ